MVDSLREKPLTYLFFLLGIFALAVLSAFYLSDIPLSWTLGILLLLTVFLLIFFKIEWAPYLLILSMAQSFELPIQMGWAGKLPIFTDDLILSMIIFAWLIRQITSSGTKWVKTPINKPLWILFGVALLSWVYSGFHISGKELFGNLLHLIKWAEYIFVFFVITNLVDNKKQVRSLIVTLVIAAVLVSIYTIFENVTGKGLFIHYTNVIGGERIASYSGTFETGHELGAFLAVPIILLTSFVFGETRAEGKVFLMGIIGLLAYTLLISYSRSSYVGVYFALMILAIFKKKPLLMWILLAFIPIMFAIFPKEIVNRIKLTYEEGVDRSTSDRLVIWANSLKIYLPHPFLGIGFWSSYLPQYLGIGPHNSFIQVLLEMGILGLLAFLWVIRDLYVETTKLFRATKDAFTKDVSAAFFALLIGFLAASLTAEIFYWSRVIGYFWLMAGFVFVLQNIDAKKEIKDGKTSEG